MEICANHSNPARWHKLVSITLTGPSGAPVAVDITPIQLLLAPPPSVTPLGGGGGTTPSLVLHAAVALAPDPTVRNPSALGIGTDGGPGDGYAEGVPGEPLAPLSPYRPSTTVKPRGVPSDSGLALGATLGSGEDPSGAVSSAVSAALAKQHKELMEAVARDVGGPLRGLFVLLTWGLGFKPRARPASLVHCSCSAACSDHASQMHPAFTAVQCSIPTALYSTIPTALYSTVPTALHCRLPECSTSCS